MRLLAALLSLSVALLLAQTSSGARKRARARADAGTDGGPLYLGPDRPGQLKPDPPARDGGPRVPAVDAVPDGGSLAQLQMQELRLRISLLEQQLAASQQQVQQMQTLNEQLQALRGQMATAETNRQQQQDAQAAQQQAVQSAVANLGYAQQKLSLGDSSIEGVLDQAQSSFSGQAQRDVQAAREALRNGDLSQCRALLNAAISDAQAGR
jgi:TolA-binding protein